MQKSTHFPITSAKVCGNSTSFPSSADAFGTLIAVCCNGLYEILQSEAKAAFAAAFFAAFFDGPNQKSHLSSNFNYFKKNYVYLSPQTSYYSRQLAP